MNYEQKSDYEINGMVAEALGKFNLASIDYCNSPSDAWPIIQELLSTGSVVLDKKGNALWFKDKPLGHSYHATGGTLRALMIIFLKMREATA